MTNILESESGNYEFELSLLSEQLDEYDLQKIFESVKTGEVLCDYGDSNIIAFNSLKIAEEALITIKKSIKSHLKSENYNDDYYISATLTKNIFENGKIVDCETLN